MGGLYIHIPFCKSKCIYCDFYSLGSKSAPWHLYVSSVINELKSRLQELPESLTTIYIGGGTPSQMPKEILEDFIRSIEGLCRNKWNIDEFTIEVNPDDITAEYVDTLLSLGINRISMGIQSFNDSELRLLNRRHSSIQAINAYKLMTKIPNQSLDLIFGLPNQTIDSWQHNLSKVLELRPKHISAYSLMFEEGTALYIMRQQGRIKEVTDEVSTKMFEILVDELTKAGYIHYEISNFALPGFQSLHNSNYWRGISYLGLGPSAHSYNGKNIRRYNPNSVRQYIDYYSSKEKQFNKFYNEELLSNDELFEEYILTRLRMKDGIDIYDLKNKFGACKYENFISNTEKYIKSGDIIKANNIYSLSEQGIMISDMIFVDLI